MLTTLKVFIFYFKNMLLYSKSTIYDLDGILILSLMNIDLRLEFNFRLKEYGDNQKKVLLLILVFTSLHILHRNSKNLLCIIFSIFTSQFCTAYKNKKKQKQCFEIGHKIFYIFCTFHC